MTKVKPKKHLGQHFLKDSSISKRIVDSVSHHLGYKDLLEIGPGTGALTSILKERYSDNLKVVEVDKESIDYLRSNLLLEENQIIAKDFLKLQLSDYFKEPFGIIGNLPYNISSQIFFKVLENRDLIPETVCMIQKEVADRICAAPPSRQSGILTILIQAFYDVEYLFTVKPDAFLPPPKVQSAVISLKRNTRKSLPFSEKLFTNVVKMSFQGRRKKLRNALKSITGNLTEEETHPLFFKRAEELTIENFIEITTFIKTNNNGK